MKKFVLNIMGRVSEMDNTKVSIEVEASAWLTETGIETVVYIGDVDMPQVVKTETLESLINNTLLSYGFGDTMASIHKKDVEQLLATLKNAYEYAERKVQELGYEAN